VEDFTQTAKKLYRTMACGASLETRTVKITVAASKIAEKVWKCTRTIDKLQRYRTYVYARVWSKEMRNFVRETSKPDADNRD